MNASWNLQQCHSRMEFLGFGNIHSQKILQKVFQSSTELWILTEIGSLQASIRHFAFCGEDEDHSFDPGMIALDAN